MHCAVPLDQLTSPTLAQGAVNTLDHPGWYLAVTLGLLLGAALLAGFMAQMMHLPRVTAYLLVGLLLGPHTPLVGIAEWFAESIGVAITLTGTHIPAEHLHYLEPIGSFAIALVLFNMGCHFPLTRFRRIIKRLLPISLGELSMTMVMVTGGMSLLGLFLNDSLLNWQTAVLFGALALATAPATTVLVLKENRSEGPVTEFATGLVALNNLASIVLFELLFVLVHSTRGGEASIAAEFAQLASNLGLATALGFSAGLVVSFCCGILLAPRWLILLTAVIAPVMGVCELLEIPYLLTFLTMGVTVASTSDNAEEISTTLDRLISLLCVVFFVIHGAAMDLNKLWAAGAIGVAYIVLRCSGKYLGVFLAADAHRDGPQVKRWLGAALLSQAGAAIALSAIAVERDPALGEPLQDIILGTVVFFEIIGPILVRSAVLRSGEVPVAVAILHTTSTPLGQLRTMAYRILQSLGVSPVRGTPADRLDVSRVTRRNVKPLKSSDQFSEVLDYIEQSHDNTYPVVNDSGQLVGIIRYRDMRDVLFEPTASQLVTAEDLAIPANTVLQQDATLGDAWRLLNDGPDDCLPVVAASSEDQYVGIVRQRDLLQIVSKDVMRKHAELGEQDLL